MDLLSAIATCSLHGDISLVIAMAMSFSHGNPYTVLNAAEDLDDAYVQEQEDPLRLPGPGTANATKAPRTRAEAEAQLRAMAESHGAPVVGLLPVPVEWAAQFARKPTDLFNGCINISIATAKLSEFEYECGAKTPKAGRACVLAAYAEAVGMDDFEQDVLDELDAQGQSKPQAAVIETEEMLNAPLKAQTTEDRDRQWGADRLFFDLPPSSNAPPQSPAAAKSGGHGTAAPSSPPHKK